MNKFTFTLLACLTCSGLSVFAQEINVTSTGVEVGAAGATGSGALIQQSGQTTSFVTKDGVNPPEVRMVIKPDGKVGIGTTTPAEKLTVDGNTVTTGSATVGSLVVGSSPILSVGNFESAPLAFPGSGVTTTITHGLGGLPRFSTISLRCITAEYGWSPGDEILLSSIHAISNNHGITVGANTSQFKIRQYGNIYIHRLDANSIDNVNAANWRLIVRAWR